jgi:hypothetical protein
MTNTVIALKKSATPSSVPVDLANGELAINYADGKLYYKAANGTIASISGNEPNYFGTVNANNTLVVADTPGDILTIAAGKNIDIVGDAINDKLTVRLTDDVAVSGLLSVTASSGDEGGEIRLANAVTNSLLAGPVNIDIFQNQLRFFVSGGDARGAFINLAATSAGVGTDLLAGASATDTVARATAGQAFDKANAALPNVSGAWFNGTLTASQNLVADKIISTNNGNGENFKIGDDVWIGDFNVANSLRIKGQQNASIAYINFGVDDTKTLGRSGTGPLTYDGNTVWHAGNDGTGTGLDADLLDGQHGSYYGIASDVTGAFTQANTARSHANAAFLAANNAVTDFSPAFIQANTARDHANASFGQANIAYAHANAAFLSSNAVNTYSDSTYVKLSASSQTITGDLDIVGNLTLSGNTFSIDATRLEVDDPLLYLAANNYTSDIVDIGFIANYVNATGSNVHTGLYREHTDKEYYLFQGYDKEPINNHIGALSNNMTLAVLNADIKTSNLILGGANAIVTIGKAFDTANLANSTATNALPNTSGVSFNGNLNVPGTFSVGANLIVGNATPNVGAKLQVYNTSGNSELWITADNGYDPTLRFTGEAGEITNEGFSIRYDNSVGDTYFENKFGSVIAYHFLTSAVEALTIQSDGKVGVGITNPGYILDVKGVANVSSALLVNDMNVKPTIESSFEQANTARVHANASFEQANSAETHANASFLQANTARVHANAAFLAANNASFDSGTRLAFQQTAAPTGWTKDLTHNNKALRIINGTVGTGGTVAFTTAFASQSVSGTVGNETATGTVGNQTATGNISTQTIANMVANTASADGNISNTTATGNISNTAADGTVGGTTLTTANIPSHRHTVYGSSTTTSSTAVGSRASTAQAFMGTNSTTGLQYHTNFPGSATQALDVTGGDGSHTHTFTGTAHTHTFTGTAHTHNFTPTAHVHTITDNVGHNHTFTGTAHTHTFTGTAHTHTFTGTAIDLAVQYVDFIIASKD